MGGSNALDPYDGILSNIYKEWALGIIVEEDNFQRSHIARFHFCEASKIGKFMETKCRSVVSGTSVRNEYSHMVSL